MSKQFEKWVEERIRQHCNRPGMITGAQHPLGHYQAKRAAMLAWDQQQKKIDDLLEALKQAVLWLEDDRFGDDYIPEQWYHDARAAIAKARGEDT